MKNPITLIPVCVFTIMLTGCSSGLSGTYQHKESGQKIEFTSATSFNMVYPDGAIVTGTYKKPDDGYELILSGGTVVALAGKNGKFLMMDDNRYVKQKGNFKIPAYLLAIYGVIMLLFVLNGIADQSDQRFLILFGIFWPIAFVILLMLIIFLLIFGNACVMPDLNPYADTEYPRD